MFSLQKEEIGNIRKPAAVNEGHDIIFIFSQRLGIHPKIQKDSLDL